MKGMTVVYLELMRPDIWTGELRLGGFCKRSWLGIDKEKGVS